jgi:hypothetical protein
MVVYLRRVDFVQPLKVGECGRLILTLRSERRPSLTA